jgi:peptide/nickel transport system substrate-binding protein
MADNYWTRAQAQRLSRRRMLAGAGAAGVGAAGLALVGCGDDDDGGGGGPAGPTTAAPTPAQQGVATAATAAADKPVRGGTLRLGTWLNVLGIDPHIEVSVGLTQMSKVYSYLGGFSSTDQKFYPQLAESVETPSPTEFIFKLRKDVKFQNVAPVNGRALTAEDVLYSLQRFRDIPQAQNNDFFKTTTDKMQVIDQYTFKLTTKLPYAESLSEIGGIQKAIVAKEDVEAKKDLSVGGVGSGPFIIKDYEKGVKLNLERNPDYFDKDKPYPDKITWQTILDQSILLAAYKNDQLDINGTLLTKLDFEDLQKNNKLVNVKIPALHYGSLGMNASIKPFNDPRVRQAIYVGVDRKPFIDKVFLGEARVMGPLSAGLDFWALTAEQLKPYIGPDIQKAKELLSAAGYADGLSFDIETSGGVQLYIDHAEVLLSELKKIGINATLKLSDLPSYLSTKLFTGEFGATVFTHNPYESPKIPLGFYHKNGLGNGSWWHYDNPAVTAAIDKQAGEMDVQKRKQLVLDAQKLILDDYAPLLNFASPTLFNSYHKRVGGYDVNLRGYQAFRISEYINPNA